MRRPGWDECSLPGAFRSVVGGQARADHTTADLAVRQKNQSRTFAELQAAFGSVDKVEHVFVFNVGGNKLRVIAAVHVNAGKVFVRHVLSHAECDLGAWKRREGIQ